MITIHVVHDFPNLRGIICNDPFLIPRISMKTSILLVLIIYALIVVHVFLIIEITIDMFPWDSHIGINTINETFFFRSAFVFEYSVTHTSFFFPNTGSILISAATMKPGIVETRIQRKNPE